MLVCRDLEKAKTDYGFTYSNQFQHHLEKVIKNDFLILIRLDKNIFYFEAIDMTYEIGFDDNSLDFLYDMIKDGVIEKVEA